MADQAEAAYRASLTKVVDALVHKILCHGSNNESDTRASLLKVLPDILQSNQLSVRSHSHEEMLAKAILADDLITVTNIVNCYPELLHKKNAGYQGLYRT